MKSKQKIWLGVGAFVVVGAGAVGASGPLSAETPPRMRFFVGLAADAAMQRAPSGRIMLAQHADHSKEAGEGGEQKGIENLPPDLAFAVRIALVRGHLLVGDQLIKQREWNAALPHFLHPTEELYPDIKDHLAEYNVPQFDAVLVALADLVKARKGGDAYVRARKQVGDALAAADAGLQAKHGDDWSSFVTEAGVETIKAAAEEYGEAVSGGRIVKPVEYQDARGFIWEADRMIANVAPSLQKKDPAALKEVRTRVADIKKVFPTAVPPRVPVKDQAALLAMISQLELTAVKLM
ncbi:MAG TPA: hypothetical protein VH684_31195 [Xanthobacteraceae bacterium]|jgi:hypothetical protein